MMFVGNSVRSEGLIAEHVKRTVQIFDADLTDGVLMGMKRKRLHLYRRKVIASSYIDNVTRAHFVVIHIHLSQQ